VAALVASLLAPFAIYWICRNAALAMSAPVALAASAILPPTDHSETLKLLVKASANPKFKLSGDMVEQAKAGLVAAPLAFEPFYIAGKAEEQAGRLDRALRLMEEAKRRRPTHTGTRAQLLVLYGRKSNYPAFLSEIDYVLRRSSAAQEHLLPEMTKLIADPAGREALAQMLAAEPSWREHFFAAASVRNVNSGHASALLELIRARKPRGDMGPENRFYVQSLMSEGRYGRAKEVWARLLPGGKVDRSLVFDGEFRGAAAPPPFNWVLQDADVGRASIASPRDQSPGLEVEYFGGKNIVLAEQILTLAPGRYRFAVLAQSDGEAMSGNLFWRVSCLPQDGEVMRVPLTKLQPRPVRYQGSFVVPGGACSGQKLQLVAEAGDVASSLSVRLSELTVRRGG